MRFATFAASIAAALLAAPALADQDLDVGPAAVETHNGGNSCEGQGYASRQAIVTVAPDADRTAELRLAGECHHFNGPGYRDEGSIVSLSVTACDGAGCAAAGYSWWAEHWNEEFACGSEAFAPGLVVDPGGPLPLGPGPPFLPALP